MRTGRLWWRRRQRRAEAGRRWRQMGARAQWRRWRRRGVAEAGSRQPSKGWRRWQADAGRGRRRRGKCARTAERKWGSGGAGAGRRRGQTKQRLLAWGRRRGRRRRGDDPASGRGRRHRRQGRWWGYPEGHCCSLIALGTGRGLLGQSVEDVEIRPAFVSHDAVILLSCRTLSPLPDLEHAPGFVAQMDPNATAIRLLWSTDCTLFGGVGYNLPNGLARNKLGVERRVPPPRLRLPVDAHVPWVE
jgi:hypothetical protein